SPNMPTTNLKRIPRGRQVSMDLRLATANKNFHRGDRPIAPRRSPLFGNMLGRAQVPPLQIRKSRNLRRDPVGAPPVGALAPLSLTSSGIFIGDVTPFSEA